jgi:ABC-type phosphate transport system permease subunit
VPSIVIGVFAYGVAVLPFHHFSGAGGGFALGIMMLPLVMRTTEELLLLVPQSLREGRWRSARRARAPCSRWCSRPRLPGILTGILLALARVAGENRAAALHRAQQRLLHDRRPPADLDADGPGLHLRHLARTPTGTARRGPARWCS